MCRLCVSETWLNDNVSDQFFLNNNPHNAFRCDRTRKRGDGCAIFIKSAF